MLEVRLLGTFEIKYKTKDVRITSRPAQSLFAHLIINAGASHRREKLAGMLWPDSLEETARDNLRHALWRVRKALEAGSSTRFLHADDLTISFRESSDYRLDAAELERVSEQASADELIAVLSDYQGELLPGFYDEWVISEREHLASIFEHHMARLMALLQEEGRWLDILDWGERWLKLGQKPEPAYRALMSAHAAKGDMSKVAATYERCLKSLREFGIEPSEQTKELYRNLKSGKETPKTRSLAAPLLTKGTSSNIPAPLTSFIGREKELMEIARVLSSSRLVTLTGPGGVGKTRLAIQTSRASTKKFRDGVFWVSLVGLSDANLIPHEIAQSLNLREASQEPLIETLKMHLKPKDILIVLDNCEHLIKDCAQYAEQLLAACPNLKILATSIEILGIYGETIWQVPSLPWPERQGTHSLQDLKEFASIELFYDRAANAKSGFILHEQNIAAVIQICRRLDGIPLALELAAARVKVLSVDEIAERLNDRFSMLTAGSRTAIARHQTLRATMEWSHELLTQPEKILFRRLAVFAGGFTLEAVEAVCAQGELKPGGILDLLGRLVDKSLVMVEATSMIGGTRYRLLETIRQYALEKLMEIGEVQSVRDQHVKYFVELSEQAEPNIFGDESAFWFKKLSRELDNIRAAMDWSTNSGNAVAALRIAGSLVYFWFVNGPLLSEWHERIQQALLRSESLDRTSIRAKALNGIGFMYWADMYPTDRRSELEEALSIGRELGDPWNVATALRNLGLLANIQGNYLDARPLLEQSLDIWRQMGSEGRTASAWTLTFLGDVALNLDEADRAQLLYEEAVGIWKDAGDMNFQAYSVRRLAQLAWRGGDYAKATDLCTDSLNLNLGVGDRRGVIACLAGFAAIAVAQGKLEWAAQLVAAIEIQLDLIGIRFLQLDNTDYERNRAHLRANLDETILDRLWMAGEAMSFEQAIAFAFDKS